MIDLVKDFPFVALDIETTGLTPVVDRIVEIGAIKFRNKTVLNTFQELIDPGMPISPAAFAVNGITDEMVRENPTIEKIFPEFIDFVHDTVPIAHNVPFDVGFLSYDISRLSLGASDKLILDTCAISKKVFPHFHSYSLENLARDLRIRSEGFTRSKLIVVGSKKLFRVLASDRDEQHEEVIDGRTVIRLKGVQLTNHVKR